MKVFISVDMEGISGVTDPEDVLPAGSEYRSVLLVLVVRAAYGWKLWVSHGWPD